MTIDRLEKRRKRKPNRAKAWSILIIGVAILLGLTLLMTLNARPVEGRQELATAGPGSSGGFYVESDDIDQLDILRVSQQVRRLNLEKKIDVYLERKGSPLAGMGAVFIAQEERTGVSAALIVAVSEAESTCGTNGALSRTNHNVWGMKGPQPALGIEASGGYCCWPDWENAIAGAADFMNHYWGPARYAGDLKGYAASSGPGSSWFQTVEGARAAILACSP